ncbi:MAG: hypothetical protein Q8N28_03330 [bacterium]|nr:hypothetical protein [bacterium]
MGNRALSAAEINAIYNAIKIINVIARSPANAGRRSNPKEIAAVALGDLATTLCVRLLRLPLTSSQY